MDATPGSEPGSTWNRPVLQAAVERTVGARNRARLAVFAAVLLATVALVRVLDWFRPPARYELLALQVTEYQSPEIPVPPWSHQDADSLAAGDYFPRVNVNRLTTQKKVEIGSHLRKLEARTGPTILYLSCAARTTSDNRVLLIPAASAGVLDDTSQIPLRTVLEALSRSPSRKKLLILDVTFPIADPRIGILSDDVASRIPNELESVPDEHRVVFCSCSPGQTSLSSEELGRSVFSYYFEEALRGWAELANADSVRDGRVSVREMASFVTAHVDRWARLNRNTRQTPVLHGSDPAILDDSIAVLRGGEPLPHLPANAPPVYPPLLSEMWEYRDRMRDNDLQSLVPDSLQQLESAALRLEDAVRRGIKEYRGDTTFWKQWEEPLRQLRKNLQPTQAYTSGSAPLSPVPPKDSLTSKVESLLISLDQATLDSKGDEAEKARQKLIQAFLPTFKGTAIDQARALFSQLRKPENQTPATIGLLDRLSRTGQPEPLFAETLLLRRLADLANRLVGEDWPKEAVRLAVEVLDQKATALSDPRGFACVKDLLSQAEDLRHEAEVLLFAPRSPLPERATVLLEQCGQLYDQILPRQASILRATTVLHDAMTTLPACVPYLIPEPDREATWDRAMDTTELLHNLFRDRSASPELLSEKAATLAKQLGELLRPFQAEAVLRLIERSKQDTADGGLYLEMEALLTTPFLRAPDRQNLWNASRQLAQRLNDRTLFLDQEEGQSQVAPADESKYEKGSERAEAIERDRAARRGRLANRLLELARSITGESGGGEEVKLPDLGKKIAEARKLLEALDRDDQGGSVGEDLLRKRELAHRLVGAGEGPSLGPAHLPNDPTLLLRVDATQAYRDWLIDRLRYEENDLLGERFHRESFRNVERDRNVLAHFLTLDARPLRGPSEAHWTWRNGSNAVELGPGNPAAVYSLRWKLPEGVVVKIAEDAPFRTNPEGLEIELPVSVRGTEAEPLTLSVLNPSPDWLEIDRHPLPENDASGESLTLGVRLKPEAARSGVPAPTGLLVRATILGRRYHCEIPIRFTGMTERFSVYLRPQPADPTPVRENLSLRPVRSPQSWSLYVLNPSARARTVSVELLAEEKILAASAATPLKGKTLTRIGFPPPAKPVASPEVKPPEGKSPEVKLTEWSGPLRVRVVDSADPSMVYEDRELKVELLEPRDYVRVSRVQYAPADPLMGSPNRLSVQLRTTLLDPKPDVPVALGLSGDLLPGLVGVKEGLFQGKLTGSNPQVELFAEDLRWHADDRTGLFSLSIDADERAVLFRSAFADGGAVPRVEVEPQLRLRAPSTAKSGPPLEVRVEVDNAPPGASVELQFGRLRGLRFEPEGAPIRRDRARHRSLAVGPSPDGALLFQGFVEDWKIPLDTDRILGQYFIQGRLIDAQGQIIRTVLQPVALNDRKPQKVQFVNLPGQAKRSVPLPLRASGVDEITGVTKVTFFLGSPGPDDTVPPNAVTVNAKPLEGSKTTWAARLAVPEGQKGVVPVGVVFENATGMRQSAAGEVELIDGDPVTPGRIKGVVMEGSIPQPNLEVVLRDAKSAEKGKGKTRDDGTFAFEDLAPGAYTLSVSKSSTNRKGEKKLVVEPGRPVSATIELFR